MRAIVQTNKTWSQGVDFVSETRDPNKIDRTNLPDGTFAIQFFDKIYQECEIDGEIYPMMSGQINVSPVVFIVGKLLSKEEILKEYPDVAVNIVPQMEHIGVTHAVYSYHKFKPFNPATDIFWSKKGEKLYAEKEKGNARSN